VKDIKLLRSMQSLGFSLDEIQEVLAGLQVLIYAIPSM
jgi:DNA-binding transcriptional MerR regulator